MLPNNYVQYPLRHSINSSEAEMAIDDLKIHQENRQNDETQFAILASILAVNVRAWLSRASLSFFLKHQWLSSKNVINLQVES